MSITVHDDIDFALGGDMADLHSVIHSLREDGPVAQVRYFGEPALLFTTYESVDAAYRDDDLFPAAAAFAEMTEPSMGRTLQCMGGESTNATASWSRPRSGHGSCPTTYARSSRRWPTN